MNRILVVDDAATVRLYHRKILGDAGWATDEAANGLEALERVHREDPRAGYSLFVVDVNMPRMDGYSFVRELRRLDCVQAPVLMISTESRDVDAAAAFEAGANAYLVKPTRAHELLLHVALLLGERTIALAAARAQHDAAGARR